MKKLTRIFSILMIFTLCLYQSQVFVSAKGNCKTSTGYFDAIFVSPENNQKEVQTEYLQVIVSFSEKDIQPGWNFNEISISNGAEISNKEIGSDGSLILELSKIEQINKCRYKVKIPKGALKDNSGKVNRAFTTRFTTRGRLYLDIVDTYPANRQVDIDVSTKVMLTFNELGLFEGPKFDNIWINKGAKISSVQLDNNGTTGTITFSGLKPGVSYYVVIPEGAVQNSAGIYNRKYVLGFKTSEDKNFSVLSTIPRNPQQSVKAKENIMGSDIIKP